MNSRHCLVALAIALPILAGLTVVACSSDGGPSAPPVGFGTCEHPGCPGWGDGGGDEKVVVWDAKPLSDADTWDGARSTATGTLFVMKPPTFQPPQIDTEAVPLGFPAKVHLVAHNYDYVTTYQPDGGFTLTDVPMGTFALMSEDIDGKNDSLNTLWWAVIGQTNVLPIGVTPKSAIETILASLNPPMTLDPNKAQILATIAHSAVDMSGVAGVRMGAPHPAEAVVYEAADGTANKWVRDQETGTGPNGLALIVNMDASPYPGDKLKIKYTKTGSKGETPDAFPVAQGAVTRAYWWEAWVAN